MTIHIPLERQSSEHALVLLTLSTRISMSKRCIIVTGAGISCNAGIPVYCPLQRMRIDMAGLPLSAGNLQSRQKTIHESCD